MRRTRAPLWYRMIYFFNLYIGEIVNRKTLLEEMVDHSSTIDTYRNYLNKAGYLKTESRGMYKVIKEIPIDLSVGDCLSMAYYKFKQPIKRNNEFLSKDEMTI